MLHVSTDISLTMIVAIIAGIELVSYGSHKMFLCSHAPFNDILLKQTLTLYDLNPHQMMFKYVLVIIN